MAKNGCCLLLVLIVLSGCRKGVSGDTVTQIVPNEIIEIKQAAVKAPIVSPKTDFVDTSNVTTLQSVYFSQLHVRELTQKNDGVDVEKYLRSTGLPKGNPWCAAFVHWCMEEVNIPNTITAFSPTAHNKKHVVYNLRQFKEEPQTGDVVTFYYANLGRIGHTGFYNKRISDITYESVEGNTNGLGSREGNGVYKKFRSFNSTYSISRWAKTSN